MKIKINETLLASSKNISDFKLMVASDFHYNKNFKRDIFNDLEKMIINEKPNCLVIPGDLVSTNAETYHNLNVFLERCAELTKVIISLGDTDLKNKDNYLILNTDFLNNLERNKNIKLFRENNNDYYMIDNFVFYGYSPEITLYESKKKSRVFEFEIMNYLMSAEVDKSLYNILLTHDAGKIIKKKEEFKNYILNDIDLVISANQGIIPKVRHSHLGETSLLISRGIKSFNQLYQPEVDMVKIKKYKKHNY